MSRQRFIAAQDISSALKNARQIQTATSCYAMRRFTVGIAVLCLSTHAQPTVIYINRARAARAIARRACIFR